MLSEESQGKYFGSQRNLYSVCVCVCGGGKTTGKVGLLIV